MRRDRVLDGVGIVLLIWCLVLWWWGSSDVTAPLRLTGLVTGGPAALVLLSRVARSFGVPDADRWRWAVPLLVVLTGACVAQFLFIYVGGSVWSDGVNVGATTGIFDAAVIAGGLAATALLVSPRDRVPRWLLLTGVTVSVIGVTLEAQVTATYRRSLFLTGVAPWVEAAVWLSLGVVLLRGFFRGHPGAGPGLLVWGVVAWAHQVLPSFVFSAGRVRDLVLVLPGTGLGWTEAGVAVVGAALTGPMIGAWAGARPKQRARMVGGACLTLALLLFVYAFQALGWVLSASGARIEGPHGYARGAEVFVEVGLIAGVLLLAAAAARPLSRTTPLQVRLAAVVLAGSALLYLPFSDLVGVGPVPTPRYWNGGLLALLLVLPFAVAGLVPTRPRARRPVADTLT